MSPTLSQRFFQLAAALGLAVIAWIGWGFVGHSALALFVTALIAATNEAFKKFDVLLFWSLDRFSREGAKKTLNFSIPTICHICPIGSSASARNQQTARSVHMPRITRSSMGGTGK